jgi:ABC-type phosphate/phosphonate transport system substrate-binding protein
MGLASLPMYDLPETADATRSLWQGLAGHLRSLGIPEVPDSLTRQPPLPEHWLSPDLLFSQTCGYPLTHVLKGRVRLLAAPCYDAPGCEDANYCSVVVVPANAPTRRFEELRGKRVALNSVNSHSGFNALRALAAPLARGGCFFGAAVETGSHAASLELVSVGTADVAAIDCVTFALLSRYRPGAVAAVRELCRSALAPALPYVTSGTTSERRIEQLRHGLRLAMDDPALAKPRAALLLKGVRLLPDEAYGRIDELEAVAFDRGYRMLS